MQNLNGKIAWITGAGSGIGRAAAMALASEGATVVLTGRRKQPLDEVARTVKANGGNAFVQTGDLTRATTAPRVAKAIQTKLGRIDILVNNAGVNILKRSWQELQPDGADEVMEGNLLSAFYCVLAVLPIMRAQRDGLLIHTASWAGRFVAPLAGAAYVAAKHGVVAMSHSINHEECVNGIRSSVVCPRPGACSSPAMTGEIRCQPRQNDSMDEVADHHAVRDAGEEQIAQRRHPLAPHSRTNSTIRPQRRSYSSR